MKQFKTVFIGVASFVLVVTATYLISLHAQDYGDTTTSSSSVSSMSDEVLNFESLREHVGETEELNLNVYFVGFPEGMKTELEASVKNYLDSKTIYDTKDWWIPRIPKFGAQDFALADAPAGLPSELIPPDGKLRYDDKSLKKMIIDTEGNYIWSPYIPEGYPGGPFVGKEIADSVNDWRENNDIIYYTDNNGSYLNEDKTYDDPTRNVEWKVNDLKVNVLPPAQLTDLYAKLEATKQTLVSQNPSVTYTLYSYNDMLDWLENEAEVQEPKGGTALVFLNLENYKDQNYTFYTEAGKDLVSLPGFLPVEVQYPSDAVVTDSDPRNQQVATLLSNVLTGGVTQAKMLAALETECKVQSTAQELGLNVPGMKPTQPICAQWELNPIRNYSGNKDRRYFVADSTEYLAAYNAGGSASDFNEALTDSLNNLYRYGTLATSVRGAYPYSEAYEIRTAVADIRLNQQEFCVLLSLPQECVENPLGNYTDENGNVQPCSPVVGNVLTQCADPNYYQNFPTEKTYQRSDVFDSELAIKSMNEFSPAEWSVNFVDVPFGIVDGVYNPLAAVGIKMYLRKFLSEPEYPDPNTGETVSIFHVPFYKTNFVDNNGTQVKITSSWEKGIDSGISDAIMKSDEFGLYNTVWPDAQATNVDPFHKSGYPNMRPMLLYLTPAPDGPLNEKWGTFPANMFLFAAQGIVLGFGGGEWWVSVSGNEDGALFLRDFLLMVPQYLLGPTRQIGEALIYGMMPDGTVEHRTLPGYDKSLTTGAPHWCNEFNDTDATKREICRNFVKNTTTLQAIEIFQHALGYQHSPEPRVRYHFDGQLSSFTRLYELLADPTDFVGYVLHNIINQHTTVGVSPLWGQSASDWNAVGPHAGMKASLLRGSLREEMKDTEDNLSYAVDKFKTGSYSDTTKSRILRLLSAATKTQKVVLSLYDDWDYQEGLELAKVILSYTDQALTLMGEPDRIYDPLVDLGKAAPKPGRIVLPKLEKMKTDFPNIVDKMMTDKKFKKVFTSNAN